ncbi:lysylphosphatidylglycerol synthase domain-containing protein [Rhizobacter fulvus]
MLTITFFVLVLGLVAHQARSVDWTAVRTALLAYPLSTLLAAAALALASFTVYCSYDLIGRHQTKHDLPRWQVAAIGFTSYAFNLNLGSLVGGIAFRYRLYSRHGLATGVITQILALSMLTNWLGYLVVGGLVFALAPLPLPPDWRMGSEGLRVLGAAMLAAAGAYLATCTFATRREWRVRGRDLRLPSARIAVLQLAVSSINWLLIAAVVWTLLQHKIEYPTVLAVLLVAAVAGVITHVPAGLGVLEAVFVALLAHRVPQGELLAALVAYRAVYYLGPLALACGVFLVIDRPAVAGQRTKSA